MIKTDFSNEIAIKKTNNGYLVMTNYSSGDYFDIKNTYVFESLNSLIDFIYKWDDPDSFTDRK